VLLCDEVDRYPHSAGTEGDPLSLATRRTSTFWNRKIGIVSTPTVKGFSRIEAAFLETDQRHFNVPCAACGALQVLRWGYVVWGEKTPAGGDPA
jgi:phage terminase large subunit GpA-like protein